MVRGLTLGKFAPLHRGHQLLIETGLAETDEMTAIVFEARETEIPLSVRSGWLKQLYPSLRVVEAWDGPTEVGYTDETMRSHERYVIERLGISCVDRFYSSEPYGSHMSRALGAIDRRVDEARVQVPVSASMVRENSFPHRRFVHPLVYRDLVTRVVFLGAPCTGKTTLARTLAEEYRTVWMPEYGREYWKRHHQDRRLSPDQLVEIAEGHIRREDELVPAADRYLFVDTDATTTATFARYYHGSADPRIEELAGRCGSRYDLAFLCSDDIPYEDTWDRSGEVNRQAFQRQVEGDLRARGIPFFRLTGPLEERVAKVKAILQRHRKYMNVLDLFGSVPA